MTGAVYFQSEAWPFGNPWFFYQEIIVFGRGLWYITAFDKKERGAI
jgi:hypothetical protein